MLAFSGHVPLKSSPDSWDNSSFIPFHDFHCPPGSWYALCLTETDAKHNDAKEDLLLQIPPTLPIFFSIVFFSPAVFTEP